MLRAEGGREIKGEGEMEGKRERKREKGLPVRERGTEQNIEF